MKWTVLSLLCSSVALAAGGFWTYAVGSRPRAAPESARSAAQAPANPGGILTADGVLEGAAPEVALRPELTGIVKDVYVRENQPVAAGALLLELRNDVQQEQVALAEGEVVMARARRDRLSNGEHPEKRRALAAVEALRQSQYQQAFAEHQRSRELRRTGSASTEEQETKFFRLVQSEAEWKQAQADRSLAESPARSDEMLEAEGRVQIAEAKLRLARAELAKTRLYAPTPGRILRRLTEPGEAAGPASPQPTLVLADLSRYRVRAYVEEWDAARVQVGQSAAVAADGYPGKSFHGRVTEVLPRMGKRCLHSDAPGTYEDVFVREVLIDLEGVENLPINLRVRVRIEP